MGTGNDTERARTAQEVGGVQRIACVVLVRLDNDIAPGRLYQYRVRMKMQNPNWVARGRRAPRSPRNLSWCRAVRRRVEIIEGPRSVVPERASVACEDFCSLSIRHWRRMQGDERTEEATIVLGQGEGLLRCCGCPWGGRQLQRSRSPTGSSPTWSRSGATTWAASSSSPCPFGIAVTVHSPQPAPDKALRLAGPARRGVEMDPTRPGPTFVVVEEGRYLRGTTATRIITDESAAEVLCSTSRPTSGPRSLSTGRRRPSQREETWRSGSKDRQGNRQGCPS